MGNNTGDSWPNAYVSLADVLTDPNTTTNPSEIWVAAGTYKPTYDYELDFGARGKHFRMINGVAIYGGFAGTETALDQRDIQANETILSGDLNGDDGPGFTNNSENCYHVFYHPLETELNATAILDGFTIANGNANSATGSHYTGGGMFNEYGNPTVSNCTFTGNTALFGGGMYNYYSNPNVSNCIFSNNSASGDVLDEPSGGGLSNEYCNPMVTNCTFTGNAALYGGAMDNYYSDPLIFNCFFSQNSAVYGAGMNNLSSSPFVMDCTFSDNIANGNADSAGGGMSNFLEEGSSVITNPTVAGCIFSDNSAVYGGGMENEYRDPTVMDCLFSGNTADDGGGMYNFFSSPTVTECAFNGNTALYGGGVSNEDSNSLVVNCLFSGNLADFGGGMDNLSSSPFVTNCTFSGNTAFYGGGMDNDESSPTLSNNIFWDDEALSGGDEIYNDLSTPVIAYSDIAGSLIGGVTWDTSLGTNSGGNIDVDPLFILLPNDGGDGWGDANDDYGDLQLKSGSPCIDAANGDAAPNTDSLGNPRIDDPLMSNTGVGNPDYVDIGAYESQDPCVGRDKADFDCNGIVNMADFVYFASHWLQ